MMRPRFHVCSPVVPSSTAVGWGQSHPRPWVSDEPGPSTMTSAKKKPKYESFLKRTIPFVSLSMNGKNMCVDSIISNTYIKIAEDNVSPQAIVAEVAAKISVSEDELILLDPKFVPLTDADNPGSYLCMN